MAALTKEQIIAQMKEKHNISDEDTKKFNAELVELQTPPDNCTIDDPNCEACGS